MIDVPYKYAGNNLQPDNKYDYGSASDGAHRTTANMADLGGPPVNASANSTEDDQEETKMVAAAEQIEQALNDERQSTDGIAEQLHACFVRKLCTINYREEYFT